ncbi:unnamed protein product [Kuraishia capsulata CBS 1993]|uniref:6-phosphofructo-2-kinase domain-containing protein n=1 Tax=Kuraishia capsulata CBS 1993 TaxID=1382522 RepID=W6MV99_9ASCO|nr:uncharacterized protein KUCA_T00002131001 [Kuraishia capsulata CBS 1993]CDK26160.1 unnamed protein product [Kuraishia capsulata CBS 1993]
MNPSSSKDENDPSGSLTTPKPSRPSNFGQYINDDRSISPMQKVIPKNVSFTDSSPKVYHAAVFHESSDDVAIVSDEEEDGKEDDRRNSIRSDNGELLFKLPRYVVTEDKTVPEPQEISEQQEEQEDDDAKDSESLKSKEDLPEFKKRPLSDTPVMSASNSPTLNAFSPLDLSSDEEDNHLSKQKKENKSAGVDQITKQNTIRNRKMSLSQVNEALNNIIDTQEVTGHIKTTLDIPGQTRSKSNPDGTTLTPERVVVVMIGLPARGKSYLSNKLTRYLNWLQINCRLFNVGSTRRQQASHLGPESSPLPDIPDSPHGTTSPGDTTHRASFFSPDNQQSNMLREKWAKDTLNALLDYLLEGDGCVGIFDATNSTKARRKMILETIHKRSDGQLKVLFLESICSDPDIIDANVRLKLAGPDYKNMDPDVALMDFVARLHNYERAYETIDEEEEGIKNFQYIKMIDVGRKVIAFGIKGYLASQIVYYLLNFNLSERQIWIARHGESIDNVSGRIGGDAPLTERGIKFSNALARFMKFKKEEFRNKQIEDFKKRIELKTSEKGSEQAISESKPAENPVFSVWTSMMQRSIETVQYFPESEFDIKEMRMLNELGAGKCEGMTYAEIQKRYPQEFSSRIEDKLTYRYPGVGGESYLDVINRLRPVITEIERTTNHLLLVTHRVVARVLLAYFLNLSKEAIGDLDIPLHTLYLLEPKPFGVDWHMYEYNESKDWFYKIDPGSLDNARKVKQVGISFRERKYSVVPTAPRRTTFSNAPGSRPLGSVLSGGTRSYSNNVANQRSGFMKPELGIPSAAPTGRFPRHEKDR